MEHEFYALRIADDNSLQPSVIKCVCTDTHCYVHIPDYPQANAKSKLVFQGDAGNEHPSKEAITFFDPHDEAMHLSQNWELLVEAVRYECGTIFLVFSHYDKETSTMIYYNWRESDNCHSVTEALEAIKNYPKGFLSEGAPSCWQQHLPVFGIWTPIEQPPTAQTPEGNVTLLPPQLQGAEGEAPDNGLELDMNPPAQEPPEPTSFRHRVFHGLLFRGLTWTRCALRGVQQPQGGFNLHLPIAGACVQSIALADEPGDRKFFDYVQKQGICGDDYFDGDDPDIECQEWQRQVRVWYDTDEHSPLRRNSEVPNIKGPILFLLCYYNKELDILIYCDLEQADDFHSVMQEALRKLKEGEVLDEGPQTKIIVDWTEVTTVIEKPPRWEPLFMTMYHD